MCPSGTLASTGESSYGRCDANLDGGNSRPNRRSPPRLPPPPRPPRLKRPRPPPPPLPPRPPRRPKSRPPRPRLSKRPRSCDWGAPDDECAGDPGEANEFPGSMPDDSVDDPEPGRLMDSPGSGSNPADAVSTGALAGAEEYSAAGAKAGAAAGAWPASGALADFSSAM